MSTGCSRGWGDRCHTLLLVQVVLLGDIVGGRFRGCMGLGVDRGHRLLEVGVELGLYRLQLLQAVFGRGFNRVGLGREKSLQWAGRLSSVSCECPGRCAACQQLRPSRIDHDPPLRAATLLNIILRRVQSRRDGPKSLERWRQASDRARPLRAGVHLMGLQTWAPAGFPSVRSGPIEAPSADSRQHQIMCASDEALRGALGASVPPVGQSMALCKMPYVGPCCCRSPLAYPIPRRLCSRCLCRPQ